MFIRGFKRLSRVRRGCRSARVWFRLFRKFNRGARDDNSPRVWMVSFLSGVGGSILAAFGIRNNPKNTSQKQQYPNLRSCIVVQIVGGVAVLETDGTVRNVVLSDGTCLGQGVHKTKYGTFEISGKDVVVSEM